MASRVFKCSSVAGVWLVFFASLAHAVPIATEQYIALRAVLDGLGKNVLFVIGCRW